MAPSPIPHALVVPSSVAYQGMTIPIHGLWNQSPPEGDYLVNFSINWLVQTNNQTAVRCDLAGNSPVALSQIVALSVDNTGSGSDVEFLFPDTGSRLVVSAYDQGVFPVFTNALSFYVIAPVATNVDLTIFNVHNSIPPVIAAPTVQTQAHGAVGALSVLPGSTNPIIGGNLSGTLTGFQITLNLSGNTSGNATQIDTQIQDGTGTVLAHQFLMAAGSTTAAQLSAQTFSQSGLNLRFYNGLFLYCTSMTGSLALASVNLFYSVP